MTTTTRQYSMCEATQKDFFPSQLFAFLHIVFVADIEDKDSYYVQIVKDNYVDLNERGGDENRRVYLCSIVKYIVIRDRIVNT